MTNVFSYTSGTSFSHQLSPLAVFGAAFVACVAAAISTSSLFVLGLIVALLGCAAIAGVLRQSVKLVLGLGSLALVVLVLQVVFVRTGTVYAEFGPLVMTSDGVSSGILVVLKVVCMVLPLSLAFMVVPVNELSNELVSKCHLPYKYAFAVTTAIRFIPLFMQEMSQIMEAQKARGVQFDTRNVFKKVSLMAPLAVPLLVDSVKRTDAIAVGAELRGFSLRGRESAYRTYRFAARDAALAVACVAVFALAIAGNLL